MPSLFLWKKVKANCGRGRNTSTLKATIIFHAVQYYRFTCNHLVAYNMGMKQDKDAIFKALNDSTRRLILDELAERNELTLYELTVRLITKHNLTITRQAIAKHLSILDKAGLVQSQRKGKYRVLIFNNEPLRNLLGGWIH